MAKKVIHVYHGKKSGSNKLLLVGAIGVGAYFLYQRYASPAVAGTTPAGIAPSVSGNQVATLPTRIAATSSASNLVRNTSQPSRPASAVSSQVPTATAAGAAGTNPYSTAAQEAQIFSWVASTPWDAGNKAQFYAMWPLMTASDISGLVGAIQTSFKSSAALTAFWNDWRARYNIDNGTF